jgi:hypothetical protein
MGGRELCELIDELSRCEEGSSVATLLSCSSPLASLLLCPRSSPKPRPLLDRSPSLALFPYRHTEQDAEVPQGTNQRPIPRAVVLPSPLSSGARGSALCCCSSSNSSSSHRCVRRPPAPAARLSSPPAALIQVPRARARQFHERARDPLSGRERGGAGEERQREGAEKPGPPSWVGALPPASPQAAVSRYRGADALTATRTRRIAPGAPAEQRPGARGRRRRSTACRRRRRRVRGRLLPPPPPPPTPTGALTLTLTSPHITPTPTPNQRRPARWWSS